MSDSSLWKIAIRYGEVRGLRVLDRLGFGQDGTVFKTDGQSAIKILEDDPRYGRELAVYQRLREHRVRSALGFQVPELIDWDDELRVIHMSIVTPPFLLDFAGARLDERPDFGDEVMQEWEEEKKEMFGSRWREVRTVMAFMAGMGIHLLDIHPGNIRFGDE